jgi:hypothetical protein
MGRCMDIVAKCMENAISRKAACFRFDERTCHRISRTQRKLMLVVALSGVLEERAATR